MKKIMAGVVAAGVALGLTACSASEPTPEEMVYLGGLGMIGLYQEEGKERYYVCDLREPEDRLSIVGENGCSEQYDSGLQAEAAMTEALTIEEINPAIAEMEE